MSDTSNTGRDEVETKSSNVVPLRPETAKLVDELANAAARLSEETSTFTTTEMRIALVAFALWLSLSDPQTLVDRFLEETT